MENGKPVLTYENVGHMLTWTEDYQTQTVTFWGLLGVGFPENEQPVWTIFLKEFQIAGREKMQAISGVTVPNAIWHIKDAAADTQTKRFGIARCDNHTRLLLP